MNSGQKEPSRGPQSGGGAGGGGMATNQKTLMSFFQKASPGEVGSAFKPIQYAVGVSKANTISEKLVLARKEAPCFADRRSCQA